MREILFRGKRIDNGEWVYGDLEYSRITDAAFIHTYHPDTKEYAGQARVTTDTVGQFTGMTDEKGNRIFEGDVLEYNRALAIKDRAAVFFSTSGCFTTEYRGEHKAPNILSVFLKHPAVKVIGNIHDNPELMEGGAR